MFSLEEEVLSACFEVTGLLADLEVSGLLVCFDETGLK